MTDTSPVPSITEPTFFILLSLSAGPLHGYAVLKETEGLSEGKLSLSVSTLYTSLGRLQDQGLIERVDRAESKTGPGLPRKVYQLTRLGHTALNTEAYRLRRLLAAYQNRFGVETP